MPEEKERENKKDYIVKAYSIKLKTLIKFEKLSNEEDNGNKSKTINRILGEYNYGF